ncbi:MAG: tetratricopeptide repeat protein [Opitutales bacterium]|nr:tetratricopeptide repeat protein [Opitutales bacterium]MCH8540105.1 tetratricopeptide repeat protein [Opitutales bacterium]
MSKQEITLKDLNPKLQKQADNARMAMERGNPPYAVQICQAILGKEPGCLPVRKLLRAAQRKLTEGTNDMVRKASGGFAGAMFSLKAKKMVANDPLKALASAEEVLNKNPYNISALKILAQAAEAAEFSDTAIFALETVRDVDPQSPAHLLALGKAYVAVGRSHDALAIGDQILKIDPSNGDAQALIKEASVATSMNEGKWEQEGDYREKMKNEEEAQKLEKSSRKVVSDEDTESLITDLKARIEESPDNLNYYQSIVRELQKVKRFDEAAEWLEKARATPSGGADVTLEKMASELRIRKLESEIERRKKALESDPENVSAKGELEKLIQDLREMRLTEAAHLVERYPNDMEHRFVYGRLLFEKGEYDEAIKQFQRSQKNPKVRTRSILLMGKCFKIKEQFEFAKEQFETLKSELIGMDENKKEIIYELAGCYEQMGDMDKALAEYKIIYSNDIGYRDVADKINQSFKAKKDA